MPTKSPSDQKLKVVSLHRICKFKKDDNLQLMVGKKAGPSAIGKLLSIDSKKRRVLVQGVNMVTKHVKSKGAADGKPTGRVKVEAPVDVSNVALVCPKCLKPTRVGWMFLEEKGDNGKPRKVRFCRKCKERIDD